MLESLMKKDNDVEKGVGVKMDLISQNLWSVHWYKVQWDWTLWYYDEPCDS